MPFSSLDGVDSGITSITQPPIQAKAQDRDNLTKAREARSHEDGSNIQETGEDQGTLQTRGVNPDSGGSLTRKGRIPRYLSKKTRRQRRATAKAIAELKAEQDKVNGDGFGLTE